MIVRGWFGTAVFTALAHEPCSRDYIHGGVTEVWAITFPSVPDSSRMSASTSPTRPGFGITKHDCFQALRVGDLVDVDFHPTSTSERQSK